MTAAVRLPKLALDEAIQQAVTTAVVEILRDTFSIKVELVKFWKTRKYVSVGDVSGTVGLIQKRLEGNLVVTFRRDVLSNILARVYGHEFNEVDDLMKEGAAELTNMIYGKIKLQLSNRGYEFEITLPNVIAGNNHNINQGVTLESGVFAFKFDKYTFEVVLTVNGDQSE